MKKLLFALAIVLATTVSCGKQNTEPQKKEDDRLVGCSFKTTDVSVMSMFGYRGHVYEFDTATDGIAYWVGADGKQNGSDGEFTYVLEYPKLTITKTNGKGEVSTDNLIFQNARSFYREYKDGSKVTYYKQ